MNAPLFDSDGYPSDETRDALMDWPITDAAGALDFLSAAWHWPEWGVRHALSDAEMVLVHGDPRTDKFLRLATGGWSGNEALICSLELNPCLHSLTWCLSTRGGLHIYQYPNALKAFGGAHDSDNA